MWFVCITHSFRKRYGRRRASKTRTSCQRRARGTHSRDDLPCAGPQSFLDSRLSQTCFGEVESNHCGRSGRAGNSEEDEEQVHLAAWEETNLMFGFRLDGQCWQTREQMGGSTTHCCQPNVAKAIEEACEEFFGNKVGEDSWQEHCQNLEAEPRNWQQEVTRW